MNKFQKAGLAVLAASGMAFAGGSLWGPNVNDFPSLQVRVPEVVDCWAAHPEPSADNPCYNLGGWWYGYEYAGGKAEVKLELDGWVIFKDVSISNEADGSSLISPDGLTVRLTGRSEDGKAYGGAGVGFDFHNPKSGENIKSKNGYCLTYTSSGGDLLFKLGHDEVNYSDACTFEATLTPGSKKVVSLTLDKFILPSWCNTASSDALGGKPLIPRDNAETQAFGIKIATPATQGTTPEEVILTIHQFGWQSDACDTSPILAGGSVANGLKFSMAGRTFSLNGAFDKSVVVNVINLQGAVVHTQTLSTASKTMNLNNLPTGIYMVRIPALGYTNKVILK